MATQASPDARSGGQVSEASEIDEIPDTMLAVQVVEFNKPYLIQRIPTPSLPLSPHDLLIKIATASLCHTDSMVSSGVFGTSLPCTASHEGAGTVVAVGSAIQDIKLGDRVLCGIIYHRCGECFDCKGPEELRHHCEKAAYLGVKTHGAFAEYEVVDGRECCVLPENVGFQTAAPLACAGVTVWGGLARAGLTAGETVAIVGAGGGLGHLGIQFAKALGLKVIAIDARDEALQLAEDSGADVVIDARQPKEKVVEEVKNATGGMGADATINVSDHTTAAATAVAVTKMPQPENVCIPMPDLIFRDIRIHGSLIVSKHDIKVHTNPFNGLEEVPKAVELARSGKMKGKPVVLIDGKAIEKEKKSGLKMV
ncbi:alcohol dehydrogenase protein [Rutstroemia sp. NJR-2017a BBW]|nr:alcohol dehydrogenase protein [Rutstroemia sp. NJR-2017a BBW]PQE08555.1 alcohol dehydrogenase protein [Rutstroemia sp. NJR-2017a BBW]